MKKTTIKNKNMTIDDLAKMIADGREETKGLVETIDNLAIMVANGFERVDKRFDKVEERLGKVEDRLGNVEDRLGKVEENLNTTRMDVLGIGDRFVSEHRFNQHLIRFSLLEKKVETKK